jgi:glutathione S-transferase
MLNILGKTTSINVRKVLWTCEEAGLAYQQEDYGTGFASTETDAFRALNPNAMVPVLQDGAYTLWESNAIVRYLCARESRFYPTDLPIACEIHRWWGLPPHGHDYRAQWPHLQGWYERLCQHPGAAGVLDLPLS